MVYVTLFGRPDEFVESYKQPHGLIQSMDQFTDRMWLSKSVISSTLSQIEVTLF